MRPQPQRARGRTRRTPGEMNKTELAYSEQLELMKQCGHITQWYYEPLNLRLAKKTFWKPDFLVIDDLGFLEVHEVKGFFEGHSKVRLKVAADKYPWLVIRLVRKKTKKEGGGWDISVIGPPVEDAA